MIATIKGAVSN